MTIKNFEEYLFRLDICKNFYFDEDISIDKQIKNLIEKMNNSQDRNFILFENFADDVQSYLCTLIEGNQDKIYGRVRKSLVKVLKTNHQITLNLQKYNSFSDGVLKNVTFKHHLEVKLKEFLFFKLIIFFLSKKITDLLFNDIIFDSSDVEVYKIDLEEDFKNQLFNNLGNLYPNFSNIPELGLKVPKLETAPTIPPTILPTKPLIINNTVCPEWFSQEGFHIFNEFLNSINKPSQMQMSFIAKKLIEDNHIYPNKGYSDSVYTYWLLENYNIELSKVRSLNESSSSSTLLIYKNVNNKP